MWCVDKISFNVKWCQNMGAKGLGSLSQNLIKRLVNLCLFLDNFLPEPKVHNLISSILNSIFMNFLWSTYCWKALELSLLLVVVLSNPSLYWLKSRLTEEIEYDTPHIKIKLTQDEMPFEDYLIMEGECIIEVDYCMLELVDMALE